MKNPLQAALPALGFALAILGQPLQAEVIRYTAGIDVNCPAGLGE